MPKFRLLCIVNLPLEYIKYRWKAKRRHGIHSPFVYNLMDKCLRIKTDSNFDSDFNMLKSNLRRDDRKLLVKDLGAGSRKLEEGRSVRDICRISSSKGKYGLLLFQLTKHYQPKRILEFGTSLGIGTFHFSKASPDSEIITVEACPSTLSVAIENFNKYNLSNILAINESFDEFLKNYRGNQFDLIFIDGHHDGDALLDYMERLKKFSTDDTIFVLDDIRWSDSMYRAFNTLVSSDEFHVTLDFFRFGIVLRRPQQQKEHFVLLC